MMVLRKKTRCNVALDKSAIIAIAENSALDLSGDRQLQSHHGSRSRSLDPGLDQ
jgi:hypothetical protein